MSEELIQRNLVEAPEKMGDWNFYNIGATTLRALKNAKIIPNRDYAEFEGKKPDALIVKKPLVIAAIEYKTPQELRTKTQIAKAIAQELGTARALQARVYIVTDGKKSFWVNPSTGNEILQEDGSKVTLNFDKNSTECIALISKIRSSINARNDQLKATAMVDPLPLAERVWQDLWSVSGATPENCLYTFVEIFIFKYLSDLDVLKNMHSFYDLLNLYSGNNENEVLEYYASTIRVKIKELFPQNQADKTTIINGTIFVSKDDKAVEGYGAVFHRILKRFNDFGTLENIDYDFKSKLFETFLKESISKKNWGQYFTPLKVVRAIVNMVDLLPGMEVCDPACGVGKFLLEPICNDLHRFFLVEDGKLKPQIALHGFDKGFDKEEQKTIILAKANMLIYFSGMLREHPDLTKEFAELFNNTFLLQTNSILGTLARPETDKYDLILTNPPYVMSGSSNLKEEIGKQTELKQHYAINAMGIEGLFMEWIVRALKPGGKAFIVVPDGIMNRSNDKKLRDYILEQCVIDAVISLPLNTFFTTNKKTYILALTKKTPVKIDGISTLERQSSPVFTYLCSEIGETRDVNRFDIDQNDLAVASDLFNMFKGAKAKFRTDDMRCKIVSIDDFYDGSHWCVERWWSHEEKRQLGIEESTSSVSLNDFRVILNDTINALSEFDEPLSEIEKKNNDSDQIIELPVIEVFDIKRGSGVYTKKYVQDHQGSYSLYSGNTFGEFAQIDSFDFDVAALSWAIDGLAGYIMHHELPFSATNHRGVLIPKKQYVDQVDLEYVQYILEPLFRELKKGRQGENGENEYTSLPPYMIENVAIPFPVSENGTLDLAKQQEIAGVYISIKQTKKSLCELRAQLSDVSVVLDNDEYSIEYLPLPMLFEMSKGFAKYTKKYGNLHSGQYPVYSASSQKPLTHLDTYDYDGRYMTWATNGFAGTILILDGRFSINGDRGILLPKDDRTDLDFDYMKFVLEPIFREMAKGRRGDNGEDEFTKLYPSMLEDVMIPVPVDYDKHISLEAQKSIAKKYLTIQQCQQEAVKKLDTLISQKVSV
ncbi:N-6 DNA methylase [Intestinimonas butyriciproducens]|uniref:N-6 DNA methylase n=1 Tax=Intestinimonas butyriciproducens TaxID=1297617 RepID=UPI0018ABE6CC|nr:N-6 DNA methylase [Intestinimonas butyriciproducens]MDB7816864.1 N-6 DNA methylase [Intestinimonas butyriciproducens]MDB7842366.1 N-6 DNA methylase [Intestinimonas butyriciproducens]MDB7857886.1 N-6 DNA methylase [Intestinimonas butyriciproducens]